MRIWHGHSALGACPFKHSHVEAEPAPGACPFKHSHVEAEPAPGACPFKHSHVEAEPVAEGGLTNEKTTVTPHVHALETDEALKPQHAKTSFIPCVESALPSRVSNQSPARHDTSAPAAPSLLEYFHTDPLPFCSTFKKTSLPFAA